MIKLMSEVKVIKRKADYKNIKSNFSDYNNIEEMF